MSSGNRNVRSNPGALGPNGSLGDLNDDFLAFGKHGIDAGRSAAPATSTPRPASTPCGFLFAAGVVEVVADVKEGGLF